MVQWAVGAPLQAARSAGEGPEPAWAPGPVLLMVWERVREMGPRGPGQLRKRQGGQRVGSKGCGVQEGSG